MNLRNSMARRTLGRPLGHLGVDASVITAAIQGGSAVLTSAIPVVADAVEKGQTNSGKKHKRKKKKTVESSAPAAPLSTMQQAAKSKRKSPEATDEEKATSVPWGTIALVGGGGLALLLLLTRSTASAAPTLAGPVRVRYAPRRAPPQRLQ